MLRATMGKTFISGSSILLAQDLMDIVDGTVPMPVDINQQAE